MKKLVLLITFWAICSMSFAQRVKGSDTVLPLAQRFAENYDKTAITITGGGSGVGITSLLDNNSDIAMSSRKMKFTEKNKLKKEGKDVSEIIIAFDALAIIVHPDNPVSGLTVEQIEKIFTGEITSWKELGGDDIRIIPYARETSSGTYVFFKEKLMNRKNYSAEVLSMPATGAVIQSVSQTKGAIGYVGLAYLNENIKSIEISHDNGKVYIAPSYQNAINRSYQIVRPLYFYYEKGVNNECDDFVNYTLSNEAQKLVLEVGYIPIETINSNE